MEAACHPASPAKSFGSTSVARGNFDEPVKREPSHEQRLDTGAAAAAGRAHPRLETVGAQRLDATSLLPLFCLTLRPHRDDGPTVYRRTAASQTKSSGYNTRLPPRFFAHIRDKLLPAHLCRRLNRAPRTE
jgi:hypothetical protein